MKMNFLVLLNLSVLLLSASTGFAQAKAPAKPMAATAPHVAAPSRPAINAAAGSATTVSHASVVAAAFDEGNFKKYGDAGQTVIVIFSGAGDAIWDRQAPLLSGILRESEFNRIPTYQADISNSAIAERFMVKSAGTILVFKAGVERLRSTRMVNADAIRKMLRLNTVL